MIVTIITILFNSVNILYKIMNPLGIFIFNKKLPLNEDKIYFNVRKVRTDPSMNKNNG